MTKVMTLNTAEMVGAANVGPVLDHISGLPEITGIVCRGLQVTVTFAEELNATQQTTVKAMELTLPLNARIIRYSKVASEDCGRAITAGLWSDVTGTNMFYDSDVETQLNLVGAVVSQTDTYWHAREYLGGEKVPVLHTPMQLIGLGQAIKSWKEERIYVFQYFRTQLQACTTTAQCDALFETWDAMAAPIYPTE